MYIIYILYIYYIYITYIYIYTYIKMKRDCDICYLLGDTVLIIQKFTVVS